MDRIMAVCFSVHLVSRNFIVKANSYDCLSRSFHVIELVTLASDCVLQFFYHASFFKMIFRMDYLLLHTF